MQPAPLEGRRCADWARSEALDPIGTAGSYNGYLVVGWPLPWPREVAAVPQLTAAAAAASAAGIRFQTVVPDVAGSGLRVALYRREAEGSPTYLWTERTVPAASVADCVEILLNLPAGTFCGSHLRQVLVRSQGSRDRCCGSRGTSLAGDLVRAAGLPDGVTVRRTSHLGGHRFAPTILVLPEGTLCAYCDEPTLRSILDRREDRKLLEHYRGWSGLASPKLQALERAVIAETGWSLLGERRTGRELEGLGVELTVRPGAPNAVTWRAEITVGRRLRPPECGAQLGAQGKGVDELAVHGLCRAG